MKKRNRSISICVTFIIIILLIGSMVYKNSSVYISSDVYLSNEEETERSFGYLGSGIDTENNKSFDFDEFTGKWSLMEFTSDKNNEITINDDTKINKGKFYIVVLDSDYNIIVKKDEFKEKKDISFITPKSGKYIVRIVGKNASGNLNIKIQEINDIKFSNKEFFNK